MKTPMWRIMRHDKIYCSAHFLGPVNNCVGFKKYHGFLPTERDICEYANMRGHGGLPECTSPDAVVEVELEKL